ncbi:hypothetical protein CS0771_14660 [Catellatospora sp. IY07-71]|uniref:hypothetical protein n=1 Tax=Catellatospora sp. IY07-71 TaxID=2728827 RepID=UPI001BB4B43A|nr:hypothetical protein [Catellatospora sp. IY07-71]BCJ71922.1 hypothetical protein CS0771_14660 [Catellatospora sp. IY07-71]
MRDIAVAAVAGVLASASAGSAALAAPVNPAPAPSVTFNGEVHATVYRGSTIYVGGDFTSVTSNGKSVKRAGLAAVDARTGALLPWAPVADGRITALAADGSGIYLAGSFHKINGVSRDNLAKVDAGGVLHSGFKHAVSGTPYALAVGHDRLYVGGSITSVNGQERARAAAFDSSTGALDPNWRPHVNDIVRALLVSSDRVYLAGRFNAVNYLKGTGKIAAVDPARGDVDLGFWSHVTAMVHDLALGGGTLYAGIDGAGGRATAMDLAGNAKWTITTDGDVQAVAVLDGTVYLGGHFDNVCKSANVGAKGVCLDGSNRRVKLAAVTLAGDLLPWTADGNGSVGVNTLSTNPELGQLVAGGAYTAINGGAQRRFALFNLVNRPGFIDTGW